MLECNSGAQAADRVDNNRKTQRKGHKIVFKVYL